MQTCYGRCHITIAPGLSLDLDVWWKRVGLKPIRTPPAHAATSCLTQTSYQLQPGDPLSVSNASETQEWQRKNKCLRSVQFYLKTNVPDCAAVIRRCGITRISVSYLSRGPYPAAELIMSCGTYASPTWQAHSEDSSLFTRASMMTFYWMTCSSICSMQTATACFFSPIISRINSLDRLLASWWMRNCFPVHRLILRCVRRWALVALQMNQGEQTCLCVKIKRAPRLDNLMPGKLCLTAKVGWLFADFIILLPPQRKKKDECLLICLEQNVWIC